MRVTGVSGFEERVLARLPSDGPDRFDIVLIMAIVEAIIAMIENCPDSRRARILMAYLDGIKGGSRFWKRMATRRIRLASGCDSVVAAAIADEFGELSSATVADLA